MSEAPATTTTPAKTDSSDKSVAENKELATTPAEAKFEITKEQANANPFLAIKILLATLRNALEATKLEGQSPRWVRIARIRDYMEADDIVSKAVVPAVDKGLIVAMYYILEFALRAKEFLIQADAGHALFEASIKMLQILTTNEFSDSIAAVFGDDTHGANPLAASNSTITEIAKIIDKTPTPEDLDVIGKELFTLLSIMQLDLDDAKLGNTTEIHISVEKSGKVRLLQMALAKKSAITLRGLGKGRNGEKDIKYIGGRRLWKAEPLKLPARAKGIWTTKRMTDELSDTVYDFGFEGNKDLVEINELLEAMGYTKPEVPKKDVFGEELERRLRQFQFINNLKVNAKLDNSTLNRLLHLDFENKSIERAKPFDADSLANFDDKTNSAQVIAEEEKRKLDAEASKIAGNATSKLNITANGTTTLNAKGNVTGNGTMAANLAANGTTSAKDESAAEEETE
jgi:hypothetical protein